jgi:hypothetical protein
LPEKFGSNAEGGGFAKAEPIDITPAPKALIDAR